MRPISDDMEGEMQDKEWDPQKKLDVKAILRAVWLPMLVWLVGVGGATAAGFPGVICVIPLSWFMGINVGQRSVQFSANPDPRQKLVEAAIGGMSLGVFEALAAVLVLFLGTSVGVVGAENINPVVSAGILFVFLALFGGTVCAGLAVLYGKRMLKQMGQA